MPAAQAEAAGLAAHELAERRAARKRQAARTAAQARREHSEAVHLKWQGSVPVTARDSAALPLATWALLGLLIDRSSASGVLKMSLPEMQGRLSTTRPTVTGATKRLEALGWIDVDRRAVARDFNAINVYRLRHPLLRAAALACEEGGGVVKAPLLLLRRIKKKQIQTYKARRFAPPVYTMKGAKGQGRRVKASAGPDGTTGGPSSTRRTGDEKRRPVCRTAAPCPSPPRPRPF